MKATANKHERMYQQIENHGLDLIRIFPYNVNDPVKLCKRLHRLEVAAHRKAEDACNGTITDEAWLKFAEATLEKVDKILFFKASGVPVFMNGDPRGYALKIEHSYMREHDIKLHHDWGGYGIIAPEFDGS